MSSVNQASKHPSRRNVDPCTMAVSKASSRRPVSRAITVWFISLASACSAGRHAPCVFRTGWAISGREGRGGTVGHEEV